MTAQSKLEFVMIALKRNASYVIDCFTVFVYTFMAITLVEGAWYYNTWKSLCGHRGEGESMYGVVFDVKGIKKWL